MNDRHHNRLIDDAKRAINELFSDTSVAKEVTIQDLLMLRDEIGELLELCGYSPW